MSEWTARELEQMPEGEWRVYSVMRWDAIESRVEDVRALPGDVGAIERRCAARRWHGPAIKGIIGTLVSAALGILGWLAVKVLGT